MWTFLMLVGLACAWFLARLLLAGSYDAGFQAGAATMHQRLREESLARDEELETLRREAVKRGLYR